MSFPPNKDHDHGVTTLGEILAKIETDHLNRSIILSSLMNFPKFFTTEIGERAVVLSYYDNSFYGCILNYDNCMGCQLLTRWDATGKALDSYGDPMHTTSWDLRNPRFQYQEEWDKLPNNIKNTCIFIYKETQGRKITGIKEIRWLTGLGLATVKAIYEQIIPDHLSSKYHHSKGNR